MLKLLSSPVLLLLTLSVLWSAGAGCSSTHDIYTEPPRPATPPVDAASTPDRARLELYLQIGASELPADVEELQFYVDTLRLKPSGGPWRAFPTSVSTMVVTAEEHPQRLLLTAELPPGAYDSVALDFDDVFVRFGPNAGAPLTIHPAPPLVFPFSLQAGRGRLLHVVLEPGLSIYRHADCQWVFLPRLHRPN